MTDANLKKYTFCDTRKKTPRIYGILSYKSKKFGLIPSFFVKNSRILRKYICLLFVLTICILRRMAPEMIEMSISETHLDVKMGT